MRTVKTLLRPSWRFPLLPGLDLAAAGAPRGALAELEGVTPRSEPTNLRVEITAPPAGELIRFHRGWWQWLN